MNIILCLGITNRPSHEFTDRNYYQPCYAGLAKLPFAHQLQYQPMKKFLPGIFCLAAFTTNAQYTATEDHTAAELLSEITGTGVTVLNPMLSCGDTTNGKYSGSGDLDFHNGIILATGNISSTFPYVDGQPYYP